ncbi:Golgin subfamily A member 2 [Geodia barretti]|uniref:Golgin subfamily A member 2 n=1 Tax=Geodia barretti TaxID=519541 RepID=A0AA35SX49_GEOBA|nr:Golgin subfamily A member 2 [Geodia barretti]
MSTRDKDRSGKLAAGRKKLEKFQARQQSGKKKQGSVPLLLSLPALETNALLQGAGGAPELTAPLPSLTLSNSLSLTTPTDLPAPVANGYSNSDRWSLKARTLTPPRDRISQDSESEDSYLQAQTIDILVAEKSSLESKIHPLQTDLRHKTREVEDLRSRLQSTRLQLEENERLKLSLIEDRTKLDRSLLEERRGREEAEGALQKMKTALEDTRQENTELVSKVTGQAADLHSLQQTTSDLRSRLTMAELLNQQLSAGPSSPSGSGEGLAAGELEELQGEVGRLEGVVRSVSGERDQALGDLDALREAMIQQRQDSAQRLSELHSRLAESEAERLNLSEQLSDVSQRQYELAQHASSEHAQYQESTLVAMETLQQENQELQTQLQSQLAECDKLRRLTGELQRKVEEGEREGERLRESAIDSGALLETMSRDKEALSRAVAQNRELKTQLVELQDGFVRLSQQNMELALDVETERFHVSQLTRQLEAASQSQEEEEGLGEDKRAEIGIQTRWEEREEEEGVEVDTQTTAGEEEDTETTNHLLHQIQEVEEERESLRLQLEELVIERDSLHEEISRLHSQLTGPTRSQLSVLMTGAPPQTPKLLMTGAPLQMLRLPIRH